MSMRALIIQSLGHPQVSTLPIPQPKDGEILVKVSHVALNPTDWKHLDTLGTPGAILGCDYAGVIVAGSPVRRKIGDRVCGVIYGGKTQGSFAEYLITREEHAFAIPPGMSDAEATTYGIGFCTAAMALFYDQGCHASQSGWFLVNGGSTSVGLFALALLRHLGIKSIATASPHSFDLVKFYGADHVVDYHADAVTEIKQLTGGVTGGLECIAGDSFEISVNVAQGGRLTSLLPPDKAYNVKISTIMLPRAFGQPIGPMPADPEAHAWFIDFVQRAESGLMTKIKANPIDLQPGGLDGIVNGLDMLRGNKVSGKKLVYKLD